jgi:hypothetical protein
MMAKAKKKLNTASNQGPHALRLALGVDTTGLMRHGDRIRIGAGYTPADHVPGHGGLVGVALAERQRTVVK